MNEIVSGALASEAGGMSFLELFLEAHIVVQAVMVGLLLASVLCWAIVIEKSFAFRRARREADDFEGLFWSGQSLEELYAGLSRERNISMAALFVAAMREWKRSVESSRAFGGIQLRVEKVMDVTISREMERLERRLLFLATVGSTAPFVGLFGTVWGIMNSFQAIAVSKNTSLAVVAPGIAEALLATAIGLVAAIPAVIFYNKYSADAARLSQRLEAFADEFAAIVSRQIDSSSGG
ncbi:MAG: protein TolQ [Hyphomicrobiaceae bacterium]